MSLRPPAGFSAPTTSRPPSPTRPLSERYTPAAGTPAADAAPPPAAPSLLAQWAVLLQRWYGLVAVVVVGVSLLGLLLLRPATETTADAETAGDAAAPAAAEEAAPTGPAFVPPPSFVALPGPVEATYDVWDNAAPLAAGTFWRDEGAQQAGRCYIAVIGDPAAYAAATDDAGREASLARVWAPCEALGIPVAAPPPPPAAPAVVAPAPVVAPPPPPPPVVCQDVVDSFGVALGQACGATREERHAQALQLLAAHEAAQAAANGGTVVGPATAP